ncbi:MAG: LysR family transcriptional regulator [Pseudomonadales bacterium]|nr:LysR family transcriptional regulator [Pseudomonadales bacterium]
MNLRQIEVFSAIMRTGSVTEAARSLHVSQPSISKLLRYTESKLGFALFQRISGRLYPTPEAEVLYQEATRINEDVAHLRALAMQLRDFQTGQVRISAAPAIALEILPRVMSEFRKRFPKVALRLEAHKNKDIPELVYNRSSDIGISHFPVANPELEAETLAMGQIVCVMAKDNPLALKSSICAADLKGVSTIDCYADSQFRHVLEEAVPELAERKYPGISVNYFAIGVRVAKEGGGIVLVDSFSFSSDDNPDVCAIPFVPEIPISLGIIVARNKPLSEPAKRFIEFFRKEVQSPSS